MDRYGSIVWERGMQDPLYIRQLQKDLKELGFSLVGDADGLFGGQTFWALREFQAYAGYETVGRGMASSLAGSAASLMAITSVPGIGSTA